MKVITNNVPRQTLNLEDLSEKEKKEFPGDIDSSGLYFRYKGQVYSDQEFMNFEFMGWDGIKNDTFFSGILVKFSEDLETVIVGRYYS